MIYTQNLEGCYSSALPREALNDLPTADALARFRTAFHEGQLAPLALVEQTSDIAPLAQIAQRFAHFEDILILGIGGSSLGGKTLYALSTQAKPRLHFLDNIDPTTFTSTFQKIDVRKTGIVAISKSGSTAETLMQLLAAIQRMGHTNPDNFIVITEPTDNPLRQIALKHKWLCLDHPTDVGGRYSCFSVVGAFPALLAGLDPLAFRKGAQAVLHHHLTRDFPPALQGAALGVALGKPLSVMMPYSDQLDFLSQWYCQLWAESLGKDGHGTTPIRALGAVDQHSQLQLYLDGPKDKFITVLTLPWEGQGDRIEVSILPEFQGKTMGDLFAAEQRATCETLISHGCPTRLITLEKLDEYHLGGLMMHFMIETILASYLLNVDAFNQPAVEEGKRLARRYMAA